MASTFEFSVLMPVYIKEDAGNLDMALKSVMEQTLRPSEVVIVEDGPLLQPLHDVISKYDTLYPGIFTIIKLPENKGMGYAMDTGLRVCRNEYVARMDSDDIAKPERFFKQIGYLKEHPDVDILGACIEEFANVPGDLGRFRIVPEKHEAISRFMKHRSPMNHMTVIFRKEKALEAGSYWHERMLEDYQLWYNMLKHKCRFYNLPEALVYARVGNNMVGRRKGTDYLKKEFQFFRIMLSDGFISKVEFYKYSILRTIIRLMPGKMIQLVYSKFLR